MRFNAAKRNIMRVPRTRDPKLFNHSLTGQVLEELMDAKHLGISLCNDWEWSNILQPWQTRLTPSFRFCVATCRATQRSLRKLLTFLWFALLLNMARLHGTHTNSTIVMRLGGCSDELQGSSKVGIQYTLVFLICLMSWGGCVFLKGDRRLLNYYVLQHY